METDASSCLKEYFARVSSDLTPATVPAATHVLFAPLSSDERVVQQCAEVISDSERSRAHRFATEGDRYRYLQRRAFRRFCATRALARPGPLQGIQFDETTKGRPYVSDRPDLCFSFSSSQAGMVGAWSATHGIGVDMEDCGQGVEAEDLAYHYFCESESFAIRRRNRVGRQRSFYRYWCLKEAALKSIGEGLPYGLDAFEFSLESEPCVLSAPPEYGGAERYAAHLIDGAGCCAALVLYARA